jgi:hypothetical protein
MASRLYGPGRHQSFPVRSLRFAMRFAMRLLFAV